MRARTPRQGPVDEPPEHLQRLDPEDYRKVAMQALMDHPGDGWVAAIAVWRHWQDDCAAWQAERGLVWGVKGYQNQLGPGRPPMQWVYDEFGAGFEGDVSTACPPDCRTHERWRRKVRRMTS